MTFSAETVRLLSSLRSKPCLFGIAGVVDIRLVFYALRHFFRSDKRSFCVVGNYVCPKALLVGPVRGVLIRVVWSIKMPVHFKPCCLACEA